MVSRHDESRGQLLLVAAVLIALVIVASAVLLNGLVTPESATTSSLSTDAKNIEDSTAAIQRDLDALFEHASSVDDAETPLPYARDADLGAMVNDNYQPHVLEDVVNRSGAILDVEYTGTGDSTLGHAIYNQTADGEFGNGTHNHWTVATGVDPLTRARVSVDQADVGSASSAFQLVVDGSGSGDWRFAVTTDAVYAGGTEFCESDLTPGVDERVTLEVTKPPVRNATIEVRGPDGNVKCARSVAFGDGQGQPWDLSIENGHEAVGTYVFAFDGAPSSDATGAPWPHHEPSVVINPAFEITYATEGLTYESTFELYNAKR